MHRTSSPIPEPSQESVDFLCHSQEREASAAAMAEDDRALRKKEKKQEADDGDWEPSSSQESVDDAYTLRASQRPVDEEPARTATQSTTTDRDSDGTVEEHDREDDNDNDVNDNDVNDDDDYDDDDDDDDDDWPSETDYPPKLTIYHVLLMAKRRHTSIECGTYGPVGGFLDKISGRRGFRHFSREQLNIMHKFIISHRELKEYGDGWTSKKKARWQVTLQEEWGELWKEKY